MWTLLYNGTEKPLAEWGLKNLRRTSRSQKADEVFLDQPSVLLDDDALFSYGDTLVIRRAGVNWFSGRVLRVPRSGRGDEESISYALAGPWWHLEDLIFQQKWAVLGGSSRYKSRVILGQDESGNPSTSGEVLAEIIDYAITAGRPLLRGTIDPNTVIPKDENKDITCGEALRKVLGWHPDCVTYFDYTTIPPTLHIRQKANLPSKMVDILGDGTVSAVNLHPRDDLRRSCVVIHYEQTGSTDGESWTNIVDDKFPPTATGFEEGALHLTIPLEGSRTSHIYQRIRTRVIQDQSSNPNLDPSGTILNYWKSVVPVIRHSSVTGISFKEIPGTPGIYFSRSLADSNATDLHHDPVELDPALHHELLEGSITDWMQTEQGVKAQQQTITLCLSYTHNGKAVESQLFTYTVTATNRPTSTFGRTSNEGGENVPQGLAENYYHAMQAVQFEGTLETVEVDCTNQLQIGRQLNLTGGRSEWATMHELIQEVEEEIDRGTTRVHFGPAGQLGPRDLIALARVTRPSEAGRLGDGENGHASSRSSARPAHAAGLGYAQPVSNTLLLPQTGVTSFPFQISAKLSNDLAWLEIHVAPGSVSNLWPIMDEKLICDLLPDPPRIDTAVPNSSQELTVYLKNQIASGALADSQVLASIKTRGFDVTTLDNDGYSHVLLGRIVVNDDDSISIAQAVTTSLIYSGYPDVYAVSGRTWAHRY